MTGTRGYTRVYSQEPFHRTNGTKTRPCLRSALTDEALDTERLDLHVDQQAAVRLHQRRRQGDARLGVCQLDDPGGDTVNETTTERGDPTLRFTFSAFSRRIYPKRLTLH